MSPTLHKLMDAYSRQWQVVNTVRRLHPEDYREIRIQSVKLKECDDALTAWENKLTQKKPKVLEHRFERRFKRHQRYLAACRKAKQHEDKRSNLDAYRELTGRSVA